MISLNIINVLEMGKFDLHLHTTASDGSFTPSEVVQMASQKGLETIAITDHDTFDGYEEAFREGKRLGITVIRGIELSTKFKGKSVDILGYQLINLNELLVELEKMRLHRQNRSDIIIRKFCELGMMIKKEDVLKFSKGGVIARPHIAQAVVDKGYATSMQEVFDLYLGDGKPCAVDKMILTPKDAIDYIHRAGGIAVLAHPLLINDDSIVEKLMLMPFDGIEVWHRKHKQEDIYRYKGIANKYCKLMTGGSDFHHVGHSLGEFGFNGYR